VPLWPSSFLLFLWPTCNLLCCLLIFSWRTHRLYALVKNLAEYLGSFAGSFYFSVLLPKNFVNEDGGESITLYWRAKALIRIDWCLGWWITESLLGNLASGMYNSRQCSCRASCPTSKIRWYFRVSSTMQICSVGCTIKRLWTFRLSVDSSRDQKCEFSLCASFTVTKIKPTGREACLTALLPPKVLYVCIKSCAVIFYSQICTCNWATFCRTAFPHFLLNSYFTVQHRWWKPLCSVNSKRYSTAMPHSKDLQHHTPLRISADA